MDIPPIHKLQENSSKWKCCTYNMSLGKINLISKHMSRWYHEKQSCVSWTWLKWGQQSSTRLWNEVTQDRVPGGHRNKLTSFDFSLWSKWCFNQVSCFSALLHNDPLRQVDQFDQPSMQPWERNLQFTCKSWHHADTMAERQLGISIYHTINLFQWTKRENFQISNCI